MASVNDAIACAIPSIARATASLAPATHVTWKQSSAPITLAIESFARANDSLALVSQLTCNLSVTSAALRLPSVTHTKQVIEENQLQGGG